MFYISALLRALLQISLVSVLLQVDKDVRHPLLLEQPSLQAAISSWRTDFELQEIFRKGKFQPSPVSFISISHPGRGTYHIIKIERSPNQCHLLKLSLLISGYDLFDVLKRGVWVAL